MKNFVKKRKHETKQTIPVNECSAWAGPIPIVGPAVTTADRAPARGPTVADLTVAPTVASADAGATAAPQCPTAAGTSAIA